MAVWTKKHTQLLAEQAQKCTNVHQLAKAIGISYKTISANREYKERLETALMEAWGAVGGEGLIVLRRLVREAESESVKLAAATKLIDVAEKQKDRLEARKVDVTINDDTSAGMSALYAKFARIQVISEDAEKLDTKEG